LSARDRDRDRTDCKSVFDTDSDTDPDRERKRSSNFRTAALVRWGQYQRTRARHFSRWFGDFFALRGPPSDRV